MGRLGYHIACKIPKPPSPHFIYKGKPYWVKIVWDYLNYDEDMGELRYENDYTVVNWNTDKVLRNSSPIWNEDEFYDVFLPTVETEWRKE